MKPTDENSLTHTENQLKKPDYWTRVTRPKSVLKLVGLMSLLILGLGVMAAVVQQSQQSTDSRSQASVTQKTIYFDDASVYDVSTNTVVMPIHINAVRQMSAVSFALDYQSADVSAIEFSRPDIGSFDVKTHTSTADTAGGKRTFYMVTPLTANGPFLTGDIGNLVIHLTPEYLTGHYVTTRISFVPNNIVTGLPNQAVPMGSTTEVFSLLLGEPLTLRTGGGGPTPTVNPAIIFPGVTSSGRLWYCPEPYCSDGGAGLPTPLPQWMPVTLLPGQTTVTVPSNAKLLRYSVGSILPPSDWEPVMRAEVTGRAVATQAGSLIQAGTITNPLGENNWPVVLGTNFRKLVGTHPSYFYTCTIRPVAGSNLKEFTYYSIGNPESQIVIPPPCQNDTRIVVQREGAAVSTPTPNPTETPIPATLTPVPPTPTTTTSLQCRSVAPKLDVPIGIAPSVVAIDGGRQFRIQWRNVLQNAAAGGGKYGVYLVDAGTPSAPASGIAYYLYDVVDGNKTFSTTSTGALLDATLNVSPGNLSTTTYTWTVPTDDRTDNANQVIRNRSFYRFLVYARLNDGTMSCSNQSSLNTWTRP